MSFLPKLPLTQQEPHHALREIRHEPVRFGLIVSVITLVAYLTFFLASLAVGLAHLYRAGIDGWDAASVAITDASNENLSASRLSDEHGTPPAWPSPTPPTRTSLPRA
ncbi:hypothetical protein [Actinomyces viscosus]|nr:hypothetical protein [Actinomyces viscosus]